MKSLLLILIVPKFALLCSSFQTPNKSCNFPPCDHFRLRRRTQLCSTISNNDKNIRPKTASKRERPRIPVLQYHDDWVCVNKPAGMTVHRGAQTPKNQSVVSTHLKRQLARKVYPVHRLDHRTSGAMLFAFDSETCGLLHKSLTFNEEHITNGNDVDGNNIDEWNSMSSKKHYIALLRGDWKRRFGEDEIVIVDKPLNIKGEMKEAKTEFHHLASTPGDDTELYSPAACSLVLCVPKTGRTHQIRRHAFSIGFPVIGDHQHGDTKINKWWRENRGLNRLFLHCLSLDLPALSHFDPAKSQERIVCTAPLDSSLVTTLEHHDMIDLWTKAKEKDSRLTMEPFDEKGGTYGRNFKRKSLQID